MIDLENIHINKKEFEGLTNKQILYGKPLPPINYLYETDDNTYEEMIACWATDYLQKKYISVRQFGKSSDKGRDVCGIYELYENGYKYDLYQCKHYDKPLNTSTAKVEIAKIIYYTYQKAYPIPEQYFFVSPKGVSNDTFDLINRPSDLKSIILKEWNILAKKITFKKHIELTQELENFINDYPLKIRALEPNDFIEQFYNTKYYSYYFGGGLRKKRETIIKAPTDVEEKEEIYVTQLLEAYTDTAEGKFTTVKDLDTNDKFKEHFDDSRNSFYLAETLEQFNRDNLPDETAFDNLKREVLSQVKETCRYDNHKNGFLRLIDTIKMAKLGTYTSNPLCSEIRAEDKEGLCHHLANEKKIIWVTKSKL